VIEKKKLSLIVLVGLHARYSYTDDPEYGSANSLTRMQDAGRRTSCIITSILITWRKKKIRIPWRSSDDVVAWHWEKSGCFSVRSAYKLAVDTRELNSLQGASSSHPDGHRLVWKKFWALPIPHKVRVFGRSNKKRSNLEREDTRAICGAGPETAFNFMLLWVVGMQKLYVKI